MTDRMNDMELEERMSLTGERLAELAAGGVTGTVEPQYEEYFIRMAKWCLTCREIFDGKKDARFNRCLYEDILDENYRASYVNPGACAKAFGKEMGQLLSLLAMELRGLIAYAYEDKKEAFVIHEELLLEVYSLFTNAAEDRIACKPDTVKETLYWFVHDYMKTMMSLRVRDQVDASRDFATRIVMESDLTETDYLYAYGEYVSENEIKTAQYLATLPEETIALMADTFTEGYRKGFVQAKKPLDKKKTVNIRYSLGFERVIRRAIENFRKMGLEPTLYRAGSDLFSRNGMHRIGYVGGSANRQAEYDHKDDQGLFLDARLLQCKKESLKAAFEAVKEEAAVHGGPACMETFGEKQFVPVNCPDAIKKSEEAQKMDAEYRVYSAGVTNTYIKGEERSFTIIAFPIPEIGEDFEGIFDETIKMNTLPYETYQKVQGTIIDALNQARRVHILGEGDNRTDLTVELWPLENPEKETIFENCVADVNIPVGEVFTSPVLEGTNGILHVSEVYLEGLRFVDLAITFENGMIKDYSCANFETEAENLAYIKENILFNHASLPMGEFAIGTNTTAYAAAKRYHMFDKLPILIAEKTGPHFAVGDTCYSHEEEVRVYNPDGKEIVAKENSVSRKRVQDEQKAYFGCHTDITIPYEELGSLSAIREDGSRIPIIEHGRFVLEGTEELNRALE